MDFKNFLAKQFFKVHWFFSLTFLFDVNSLGEIFVGYEAAILSFTGKFFAKIKFLSYL